MNHSDAILNINKFLDQQAVYTKPSIESYQNNPLIEALPPVLNEDDDAIALLVAHPPFDPDHRNRPDKERKQLLEVAMAQFFQPLPRHLDLEERLSQIIRLGYLGRNPLGDIGFWKKLDRDVAAFRKNLDIPYLQPPIYNPVNNVHLIGLSGGGKTTSVDRILKVMYPQVITHHRYNGQPLEIVQLVWLSLECPHDGSVKQLCIEFFRNVDSLLGTNYHYNYARNGRASVDNMLGNVARVASIHRLGVLVIDELQHLNVGKSGGKTKMLNFFVQLSNVIGLPIVLIGTYKTRFIIDSEFRQTRRFTGQGNPVWDRMEEDEEWEIFLEALWQYQFVRNPVPLTPDLSHALYLETQGIMDYVIKVFVAAQKRAIEAGSETITTDIIHTVAAENLSLSRPVLTALRENDTTALAQFEDVAPIEPAPLIKKAKLQAQEQRNQQKDTTSKSRSAKSKGGQQTPHHDLINLPNDLRNVLDDDNVDAYQSLAEKNFIKPATEFLD